MSYIEYVHARPRLEDLMFALAKANGFTAEELVENRSERMHPQQAKRMLRADFYHPILLIVAGLLTSPIVRILWAVWVEKRDVGRLISRLCAALFAGDFQRFSHLYMHVVDGDPLPMVVRVVLILPPLLAIFHLRRVPWKVLSDARSLQVKWIDGQVTVEMEDKRTPMRGVKEGDLSSTYYYVVKGKKFLVSRQGHDAIVAGLDYRIYYAPRTNKMLSLEPIGG